ncbi:MAG: carbohydrate ABC transporter permease [Clostridia bacterium]|nr:carbohydrate ABC transporter permease [Clostridia bacterium]
MSTIIHSKQHHPGHIRQTSADRWAKIIAYIIVGFFGLICLYPLLLTVVVSFTPDETVVKEGYRLIPSQLSLNTYTYLFDQSGGRIAKSYLVTIFITAVGTFGSMLVTCMISYAISLREMKYRNVIAFICNFTSIFSAGLVPWYVICTKWYGLHNNILGLILPMMFSVWNMFLMRTYFKAISPSLYEAAKIDGAGHMTIFFRIALPLSVTALLTVGMMYALCYWNDWWHALMFIEDRDLFPLQYFLYKMMSNVNAINSGRVPAGAAAGLKLPAETAKMAVTIVTIGPIIFLYPFIQRYFVRGILTGAVKE